MRSANVFSNTYVRILSAVLVAQAALFYGSSRGENIPAIRPLAEVPMRFGEWRLLQEGYVDAETQSILRADDTLTRTYISDNQRMPANLFVAFFKTQRSGQAPHSPKNCLPGAGWEAMSTGLLDVPIPGESPITVNRYVVARGEQKSVVLYWYQMRSRVVASEYKAKMLLVADAIRYNRSDTSLVKVVVPVVMGDDQGATERAIQFVQSFYAQLRLHLPS